MERGNSVYASDSYRNTNMREPDLRLVDDELLVERARTDVDTFEAIYIRYGAPVYRMCLRACGDPDLADDLTANIFLKAFERLDRYQPRPGSTFRSWLFTIARNTVLDHWRRNNRFISLGDDLPTVFDTDPGPEEIALTRIEIAEVREILSTLNERHRSIIEFRLSGLTTREIAGIMGITISALKSAQSRAYANIRQQLTRTGDQS